MWRTSDPRNGDVPVGPHLSGGAPVHLSQSRLPACVRTVPAKDVTGFPAAATGLSTRPPTQKELVSFTRDFVSGYRCDDSLNWGPHKVLNVVLRFHGKFPNGSWVMYWGYLAWHISDICNSKIARRAAADLYRFIDYADPTGETAVNNVTRERRVAK